MRWLLCLGGLLAGCSSSPASTSDCSPACAATEYCLQPGACQFDAHCVARSSVSCPDAGLCSAPGCAGELSGDAVQCVCR
jgi:hypothetical protein